ncbi:MAG: RimK/LysX family protein [Wenzhouxiangellaceae bacterium]|nr:RimK/LysX family protein [Wenzhouxiangellaceae bacterium]
MAAYNARNKEPSLPMQTHHGPNMIIGACEWVALPELGIRRLRARTDTGAKSCALHATRIERYCENGVERARFRVHTSHARPEHWTECTADLKGVRLVRSSTGHHQERYTIRTDLIIGHNRWSVDITLTNRAKMRYRMLLGRAAMKDHALVYPARTFLQGQPRLDSGIL